MKNNKKCIVILSSEIDNSVDRVIGWLNYKGVENIIRVTSENKIKVEIVRIGNKEDDISVSINNNKLQFSNVHSFWIRNGYFSHDYYFESGDAKIDNRVNQFLNTEWKFLTDYFIFHLSAKKKRIGNYKELVPNKLIQLYLAQNVGLKIPDTKIISDNVSSLCNNDNFITKPIKDIFTFEKEMTGLASKTKILSISKNQTDFFPSLVQNKVDNKFELRICFFNNKYFPAAIFTGDNAEIDYRSESNKENLRIVPYLLPTKVKRKLKKLMKLLKVESGSIDMIVTKNMEYIYLEVNPIGYFDNISTMCNYNIEKYIAKFLI